MGDVSQGLSFDPTFTFRSPSPLNIRSPSPRYDRGTASPSGRRVSEIHIPSPDHSVSISSSEHFDKPGLVAAQEAGLHDAAILEMGWTGSDPDEYAFMPEGEKPKSPAVGTSQDLKSLKPIRLRNMKVGKVHRGRILSGTLCCKSVKIFAVMNVLEEDGTGDATKLVISNAVPRSATTATAQRLYPEGAQLSIREPYLKRFADGMVGILVENPNDIVFNYLPDELPSPVREGENILWPVYKDPCGDGPDTPVFNIYGSFLSTPSILSRTSPDSPTTPRSPNKSLSDDPSDGLTVRTIRKFKSFRKHEQGSEGHEDDAKHSLMKLSNGDELLSGMVEYEGGVPHGISPGELNSVQCQDPADSLERQSVELPSTPVIVGGLPTGDEGKQIASSNGSAPIGDPCPEVSEQPFSPTGGLISGPTGHPIRVTDTSEVGESPAACLETELDRKNGDADTDVEGTHHSLSDKQLTTQSDGDYTGTSHPRGSNSVALKVGTDSRGTLGESLTMPDGGRDKAEGELRNEEVEARAFSDLDGDGQPEEGLQLAESLTEVCDGSAVKLDSAGDALAGLGEGLEDPAQFAKADCHSEGEQSESSSAIFQNHTDDDASAFSDQARVHEAGSDLQLEKDDSSPTDSENHSNHSLPGSSSPVAFEERTDSVGPESSQIEEELSAAALRKKGNQRFACQDWNGAIELYTRAVHKAVQESKEQMASSKSNGSQHSVITNGGETEMEVVMDYSNRAEAWLRLHHYERAWADAERALSIDPKHLKSLFRKGRALLGLGDYQQALTHLESAYARAPFDKDLLAAIKLSRIGDHQSRLGIYELTDYYLRGRFAGEIPTSADYVGPVQVKTAEAGKGRGLFLTKHVEAGELLLVSNPLALLDSRCDSKTSLLPGDKGRLGLDVQEKLVHVVQERAKVSSKNRQRLSTLCNGWDSDDRPIPSMDLFIPGKKIAPAGIQNLEEERITLAVIRNAIDRNMVSVPLEKRPGSLREGDAENREERCFWGLWVLPAFINHSCVPNVSFVVIGRALFVYASRDLSAGEELLCSYFNVFQPLPQRREIASRCWGFTCKCPRCLLESQFDEPLKHLYSFHCNVKPNPEFRLQLSAYEKKIAAQDLAKELEVIEGMKKLDHRQRCWIQASFMQLYTCLDFKGAHGNYPHLETALHAMQVVSPGSSSTLQVGLLVRDTALKESNGKKASQYKSVNQQLLRICYCIYGKQKAAVLQSLVDGILSDATTKS